MNKDRSYLAFLGGIAISDIISVVVGIIDEIIKDSLSPCPRDRAGEDYFGFVPDPRFLYISCKDSNLSLLYYVHEPFHSILHSYSWPLLTECDIFDELYI